MEVPASLDVLDVRDPAQAERFLRVRAASGHPEFEPWSQADLLDFLDRMPGELLHVVDGAERLAATVFTIRDERGVGATYVSVATAADPGEPTLGDLVALGEQRARAGGVDDLRFGELADRPHMAPLRDRHRFRELERFRRFRLDLAAVPDSARPGALPDDVRIATLAARPGLLEPAFGVLHDGELDVPGDSPVPDRPATEWLRELDESPVLSREQVVLLLDDEDAVLAVAVLERRSVDSDAAWVDFLAVARHQRRRGLARTLKQQLAALARELGFASLHTMNHARNEAICALNWQLGWTELPPRVQLHRPLT